MHTPKEIAQTLDRKSLKNSVDDLDLETDQLKRDKRSIEESLECLAVRTEFLKGVLDTHSRSGIPKHDSKESLYFFKDEKGETVLIEELEPSPDLMPEMKRIPIKQALTTKMSSGEHGYVVQKVFFCYPEGSHELLIISFEKNVFEKFFA